MALKVILLGTGDAFGSGGRGHSAVAVVHRGRTILLDCGASLLPAAEQVDLDLSGLVAVGLTHAHGDHIAGWPFLRLFYQYSHPRSEPLTLVGPPGVDRVLEQLATLLYPELDTQGPGYEVVFHPVSDGSVVAVEDAELRAVTVIHQRDHPAVGYRLSWGGRTVAFRRHVERGPGRVGLRGGPLHLRVQRLRGDQPRPPLLPPARGPRRQVHLPTPPAHPLRA